MTNIEQELSCYSTHLLLKYAKSKNLQNATAGISDSLEKLNNPHEWTSTTVWTKIAKNIENELGGEPDVLVKVTQEIFMRETNIFVPFFLKIAPMRIVLNSITLFVQKYSNKNLLLSFETIGKDKWRYKVKRLVPGPFSRQICDYNKGAVIALLTLKGYQNVKVTEIACIPRDGASACEYIVEGTHPTSLFQKVKNAFIYIFRDRNAIMQFMEQSHQELQNQYKEILSIRDFYSHIMSSMEEAIIWLNEEGVVEFSNKAFYRLTGIPENESIGKRLDAFFHQSTNTDNFVSLYRECRKHPNSSFSAELYYYSKNNETRIGQTTIIWVTSEHRLPGYLISIRDITEKRKIERQLTIAENRYRSLYENSPAIIVALDMKGLFLYANPAMTEQSGYSEDELKAMHFKELIAPQADFDVDRLIKNLLTHPTRLQEVHFKTKCGTWKCIALNTYHIHDADGSLAGIAGIGIDVTETKRLNEQIIKSQRMDLLGQLAGGLAHDFGNILTSINGFSRLIAGKSTDLKIKSYAESIERSGLRAHDLVKNLLAFSHGDSRQSVIFDVVEIAREVKDMMYGAISKSITLAEEFPDEPYFILGDPGKIHQSIVNLCVNARDAMGSRGGTITLRVKKAGENKELIHVQVEDTGSGIPPDIIEKIFDPFFTTKKKTEGTGLGLSVVYGIMKSHKGDIYVDTHPGEGTTFTLEFPAAPQPLIQS